MYKSKIKLFLLFSFLSISAFGKEHQTNQISQKQKLAPDVSVEELLPGIWLHKTYMDTQKYGKVGANGLIVIAEHDAVMIDLPWTNKQTGILFDWVKEKHHATIQTVVPTHAHIDCAGGLEEAHKRNADSITLNKTIEFMKKAKAPLAKNSFVDNIDLRVGTIKIKLSYIGGGHTIDNIVAWLPDSKVLFAGCMLKGLRFKSIGNTADADLDDYPKTLAKIKQRFKKSVIVVPGHGKPGSLELVDHTIILLKKYIEQANSKKQ